jgi:hypothetical protein
MGITYNSEISPFLAWPQPNQHTDDHQTIDKKTGAAVFAGVTFGRAAGAHHARCPGNSTSATARGGEFFVSLPYL